MIPVFLTTSNNFKNLFLKKIESGCLLVVTIFFEMIPVFLFGCSLVFVIYRFRKYWLFSPERAHFDQGGPPRNCLPREQRLLLKAGQYRGTNSI